MGIELLDLNWRLQRRFGIRIEWEQWEQLTVGRKPFDATAAEVSAMVEARRAAVRRVLLPAAETSGPMALYYQPSGVGEVADDDEPTWPGVRDAIAQALSIKPDLVRPESWLVRDLRMSGQ
jgi:hypothetical protein